MNNGVYTKKDWQFKLFVIVAWLIFPLVALFIWLTHPGKCAMILKKELTGTWWEKTTPTSREQQ